MGKVLTLSTLTNNDNFNSYPFKQQCALIHPIYYFTVSNKKWKRVEQSANT